MPVREVITVSSFSVVADQSIAADRIIAALMGIWSEEKRHGADAVIDVNAQKAADRSAGSTVVDVTITFDAGKKPDILAWADHNLSRIFGPGRLDITLL